MQESLAQSVFPCLPHFHLFSLQISIYDECAKSKQLLARKVYQLFLRLSDDILLKLKFLNSRIEPAFKIFMNNFNLLRMQKYSNFILKSYSYCNLIWIDKIYPTENSEYSIYNINQSYDCWKFKIFKLGPTSVQFKH